MTHDKALTALVDLCQCVDQLGLMKMARDEHIASSSQPQLIQQGDDK